MTRDDSWRITAGAGNTCGPTARLTPMRPTRALALTLALLSAACGGAAVGEDPTSTPTPDSTSSVIATSSVKNPSQLKLAVLDALEDPLDYCDPDVYPVARGRPIENARERFPEIQSDREAFLAILEHEGLQEDDEFTDEQLIAINELYKQMAAVQVSREGGVYRFEAQVLRERQESVLVRGTVDASGEVVIESEKPAPPPTCPICLARGARIATPDGTVSVSDLRVGDRVWSIGRQGRRIVVVVEAIGRSVAPIGHEVVRVRLADGRIVTASPGHPTANGRALGSLHAGDRLDGARVASVRRVAYGGAFTFDIRVSGPTGLYFADRVLLASTLTISRAAA
jgi:hypothetical protein